MNPSTFSACICASITYVNEIVKQSVFVPLAQTEMRNVWVRPLGLQGKCTVRFSFTPQGYGALTYDWLTEHVALTVSLNQLTNEGLLQAFSLSAWQARMYWHVSIGTGSIQTSYVRRLNRHISLSMSISVAATWNLYVIYTNVWARVRR